MSEFSRTPREAGLRVRLRITAQTLIDEIGADGPTNAEECARAAVELIRHQKRVIADLTRERDEIQADLDAFLPPTQDDPIGCRPDVLTLIPTLDELDEEMDLKKAGRHARRVRATKRKIRDYLEGR